MFNVVGIVTMKKRLLSLLLSVGVLVGYTGSGYATDIIIDFDTESSDMEDDSDFHATDDSSLSEKESLPTGDMWDAFLGLQEGVDYVPGELICIAASVEEAEAVADFYCGKLKSFNYGVATIDLSESSFSVADAFEKALNPELDFPLVEPNYIIPFEEPCEEVIDVEQEIPGLLKGSAWSEQYYDNGHDDPWLNPTHSNYQWYHDVIETYGAWGVTLGRPEIIVAVIDSGIYNYKNSEDGSYIYHEDLEGKIIDVSDEIDFNGNHNSDQLGHGTHVAGIIGSVVDNDKAGAGVAPGVSIMPISVNTSTNSPSVDYMIAAVQYVAGVEDNDDGSVTIGDRRADIINMSLSTQLYVAAFHKAIENAYESGVSVVAAMGNNSSNLIVYPAFFEHVIAVAATDRAGDISYFSNVGEWADIGAPGVDIYSTYANRSYPKDNTRYAKMSGTSMATPIVAGACALYMSAKGHVDPDTMERVLKETAVNGIVNVAGMMDTDEAPPCIFLTANDSEEGTDNTLLGSVMDADSYTVPYRIAKDSFITFAPMNYSKETADSTNNRIIFTTDGRNPLAVNGEIQRGSLYDGEEIRVGDLCPLAAELTKITVKARTITGVGVVSKVTTMIFTVDPDMEEGAVDSSLEPDLNITITDAPKQIVAGKTVALKAQITPVTTKIKTTWRIISYSDGDLSKAKITSKGQLSTAAGQHGVLTVGCFSSDGRIYDTVDIGVISDTYPVKKISMPSSLAMEYDSSKTDGGDVQQILAITSLTDTWGRDILDDGEVSFEWTSSNDSVVDVSAESMTSTFVTLTARGVGSARITCKALDGSNKTASCSVTVTGKKIVKSVLVVPSEESGDGEITLNANGSVKKAVLYIGEIVSVDALLSDGLATLTEISDPSWTVSDKKILELTLNGKNAVIKGLSKGEATVSCKATDGSGKKFSFTVRVKKAVSDIALDGQYYIAPGAGATYKASVSPSDASSKKLVWSVEAFKGDEKVSGVKIDSSGKVSVSKSVDTGTKIYITASAADGKGASATVSAEVLAKTTSVSIYPETESTDLFLGITKTADESYSDTLRIFAKVGNYTKPKFTSSNPKVVSLSGFYFDSVTGEAQITVTALSKGSSTITALAMDGSGKKASLKVQVKQLVTGATLSGQDFVVKGSKATYKVLTANTDANIKKYTWSLADAATGINVNSVTGQLTVTSEASPGTYSIKARANDGSGIEAVKEFTVTGSKATGVRILTEDAYADRSVYKIQKKDTGKLTSIQLFDVDIDGEEDDDERDFCALAQITGSEAENVVWSSSNTKVATVTDTGLVTAVSKGNAVITAKVNDGSGKKDTFKVSVITPSSGISMSVAGKMLNTVAFGKKVSVKAALQDTYGKPTVKTLKWDYRIVASTSGSFVLFDDELTAELKKKKAFFTFSNGKVTVNSKNLFEKYEDQYIDELVKAGGSNFGIVVFAYTTDGTLYSAQQKFTATDPTTTIDLYTYDSSDSTKGERVITDIIGVNAAYSQMGTKKYKSGDNYYYRYSVRSDGKISYTVSSSNPSVASAYCSDSNNSIFYIYPNKTGTTKITISTRDGSGKSVTVKFIVVEGE
jgi:uncharacterized protein YjdB